MNRREFLGTAAMAAATGAIPMSAPIVTAKPLTLAPAPTIHPDDLLLIKELYWPDVAFYSRELEIIESTVTEVETYVPAANKMGKDFTAGFIALSAFLACRARGITCRIVTTSVAEHHLKVLWGEIGRFATTAREPIVGRDVILNFQEVRRADEQDSRNPHSYLVGRVTSAGGEGLAGHHADWTLCIGDEASGLSDKVREMSQGWAHHMLWIGNCNPCANFFRRGCGG